MNDIKNLSPQIVWNYFYDFTQIPRPSCKEQQIMCYLVEFAKKHNFDYKQDAVGNLVIRKAATPGKEDRPKVTLQGHVDMVCEKNSDVEFDFLCQPIQTYIDGDWVKARGTTLGADCGIGCSIMLALLASDEVEHPALEALFTIEEETGLTGAFGIESDMITADYLINLDSEDAGEVFVGCAGGKDTLATFKYTPEPISAETKLVDIQVKGLKGGHSGGDIHLNLGNANIILARFLYDFLGEFQLIKIDGGNLRNAIPRESKATLAISNDVYERMINDMVIYGQTIKKELFTSDNGVEVSIKLSESNEAMAIDCDTTQRLIKAIISAPNEVLAMSQDMANFVETSTNLASIKQENNEIVISTSQRSSVESRKEYWAKVMKLHFETYGARADHSDGYPGWTPVLNSHLLRVFNEQHSEVLGYEAKIMAVHAGLECGLFLAKFPNLEMISYGPTLRAIHSPDEKLNIPAVEELWKLMKALLNKI